MMDPEYNVTDVLTKRGNLDTGMPHEDEGKSGEVAQAKDLQECLQTPRSWGRV